jgi:hypothetical protein
MDNKEEKVQPQWVYLKCITESRKLRVRITTNGYNKEANCQFPRNIRAEGAVYRVPPHAISFSRMGPGRKFFYRVSKSFIEVVDGNVPPDDETDLEITVAKIFQDDDATCPVCLDEERAIVIVPCGHYCLCSDCAFMLQKSTGKCPICRGTIEQAVTREQISM